MRTILQNKVIIGNVSRSVLTPEVARVDGKDWLSLEDIADDLGISLQTLYNRRSRGEGPRCHKFGNRLRVRRGDYERWIAEQADPEPVGGGGRAA